MIWMMWSYTSLKCTCTLSHTRSESPPDDRSHDLPQGQRLPAHVEHFGLELMDVVDGGGAGTIEHVILSVFDELAEVFDDLEIVVHDGIDEEVGEVVGTFFTHPSLVVAYGLADSVEDILSGFLERDDIILPHDQAHVLGNVCDVLSPEIEHLEGDQDVLIGVFDLGPSGGIYDVLEVQGMEPELLADFFDELSSCSPSTIYPGDG